MSGIISGSTASLRPNGIGRYFNAAFLSLWLAGWIVGEVVALWMMGAILVSISGVGSARIQTDANNLATSGAIGFVILFLLLWLTLWTIGGIAAATTLLRSLAGEDSITLQGSRLELFVERDPFVGGLRSSDQRFDESESVRMTTRSSSTRTKARDY